MSLRPFRVLAAFAALALFVAVAPAGSATDGGGAGMVVVPSEQPFEETWTAVIDALEANENIGIVAVVDHAAAAAASGLELAPTREVFFGNPSLGSPLMAIEPATGIDLPQKIVVWEAPGGSVYVGYNSTVYLDERHDLGGPAELATISGALAGITATATGVTVVDRTRALDAYARDPRLVIVESDADVVTTEARLLAAIETAPPSVVFTLDHAANAASVGIDLADSRLIVFGSPLLGTPLMVENQSIAVDLPLKFLVFDSGGATYIAYNDVHAVARRHGITGQGALLDGIAVALAALAASGASS